jgi:hypothetical protein
MTLPLAWIGLRYGSDRAYRGIAPYCRIRYTF